MSIRGALDSIASALDAADHIAGVGQQLPSRSNSATGTS